MTTNLFGSGNGMGRYNKALSTLNMVLFAAMPTANERITTTKNPGFLNKLRVPSLTSDQKS